METPRYKEVSNSTGPNLPPYSPATNLSQSTATHATANHEGIKGAVLNKSPRYVPRRVAKPATTPTKPHIVSPQKSPKLMPSVDDDDDDGKTDNNINVKENVDERATSKSPPMSHTVCNKTSSSPTKGSVVTAAKNGTANEKNDEAETPPLKLNHMLTRPFNKKGPAIQQSIVVDNKPNTMATQPPPPNKVLEQGLESKSVVPQTARNATSTSSTCGLISGEMSPLHHSSHWLYRFLRQKLPNLL